MRVTARALRVCCVFLVCVATSLGVAVLGTLPAEAAGGSPSTTTVTASPTGAVVSDEPVTYTATVAPVPPATATPTGNVTFATSQGGAVVCVGGTNTIALVGGVASCTVDVLSAASSPVTIVANYLGDSTYATSSDQFTQVVNMANSAVSVTATLIPPADPNPPNYPAGDIGSGKPNNFIATVAAVSPSVGAPTGDVVFTLDGTGGATAVCANGSTGIPLTRLDTAKCEVPSGVLVAADAPWTITASYSGDGSFATSSGSYSQLVHATVTETHISSNPSPPSVAEPLNITASVTVPKFGVTPTGDLTFAFTTPGNVTLAIMCNGGSNVISLSAGTNYATCTLPAGVEPHGTKYRVMATYSGDANNASSSSNWRKLLVH